MPLSADEALKMAGMAKGMSATMREDTYDAVQRMEHTSRLETRLDNEAAERGDVDKADWLAAGADGSVKGMKGTPNAAALDKPPASQDNAIDELRKHRLAQMKAKSSQRARWLAQGHGTYAQLETEARFLEEITKHDRVVCHLCTPGSLDTELMHERLTQLAKTHLETFFCWLDAQAAPMMLAMVDLAQLPALLIGSAGKVVNQLANLDRSFTVEGVAYELGAAGALDFEEGTKYGKSRGGCTTGTAAGRRGGRDDSDDSEDDEDDDDE